MRRTSNVATSLRQRPAAALALGVSLIWGPAAEATLGFGRCPVPGRLMVRWTVRL